MPSYLVAHDERTLRSSGPPRVLWPAIAEMSARNSMAAPLREAYIGSAREARVTPVAGKVGADTDLQKERRWPGWSLT